MNRFMFGMLAALAFASPAAAYTVTVSSMPTDLDWVNSIAPGTTSDFTVDGNSYSGFTVFNGTFPGLSAAPAGDTNNYLAVEANGTGTITYAHPETSFSIYWGSIDPNPWNVLKLGSTMITGSDLVAFGLSDNGDQASSLSNAYITFHGLPAFSTAIVTASENSFEFGMRPIPEASTWIMMLLGFVSLGFVGARSRKGRLATI